MIMEYAWMPGFEEIGLNITETEQLDMINGSFISPIIRMYFSDPNTGVYNGTIVQDFVANISKDPTGRSAMIWDFFKDQMIQERIFRQRASGSRYRDFFPRLAGPELENIAFKKSPHIPVPYDIRILLLPQPGIVLAKMTQQLGCP